ncbi:creatininase family protein [Saccharopolyspora gloriosae]|nr:creatininase family protein [Saccharopolyspora gloriosae]
METGVHLLSTATSPDEAARGARVAVLPVGSFEQHGGHLPLITDTVIACLIANRIAEHYDLFLLPPITVSCSHEHEDFPGTVSISAATLIAMVDDIRSSLRRSGVTKLILVNGHGGNYVLSNIAQQANVDEPSVALFPGRDDWTRARDAAGAVLNAHQDMHAGEIETSLLLHAHPELVGDGYQDADHRADDRAHLLVTGVNAYSGNGVIGQPSAASAAKGELALDSLVAACDEHLRALDER